MLLRSHFKLEETGPLTVMLVSLRLCFDYTTLTGALVTTGWEKVMRSVVASSLGNASHAMFEYRCVVMIFVCLEKHGQYGAE